MKSRVVVAAILAGFMLGASASLLAQTPLPPPACDIAGTWVGTSPVIPGIYSIPLLITASVTPTDPFGKRFTAVIAAVNGDATFAGLFPDADRVLRDSVATYVRSDPGTYRFTVVQYFVKSAPAGSFDRGQILYFSTLSGMVECLDATTLRQSGMLSVYSNVDRPGLIVPPLGIFGVHDQDKDDDGFADEGEVPFLFLPFDLTYKRLPLLTATTP